MKLHRQVTFEESAFPDVKSSIRMKYVISNPTAWNKETNKAQAALYCCTIVLLYYCTIVLFLFPTAVLNSLVFETIMILLSEDFFR